MIHALWVFIPVLPLLLAELAIAFIPVCLMRLVGLKRLSDRWCYANMAFQSRAILFFLGVKVMLDGDRDAIEAASGRNGAVCLVCNHTSILDILVLYSALHVHGGFIAKKELLKVPFVHIWVPLSHSVFIDRKNLKKGVQAIRKGEENIRRGVSMFVFPEGTRSKTGEIGSFKRGAFRLAAESSATVVPVAIKGLRRSLEDRKRAFQRKECRISVRTCRTLGDASDRNSVLAAEQEIEKEIREVYAALPVD